MPNSIPLLLTLLGATLSPPAQPDPIAPLDACIQQRFLGTRTFGMSRVLPNRHQGVRYFQPDPGVEQQVITDLKQKGCQVAWFLVGRHVLDTAPPFAAPFLDAARYGLQGPAYIANTNASTALPSCESLLAEGRRAMTAFFRDSRHDGDKGYDVHTGDWVIALRPLCATSENCAQCHTSGPGALLRDDAHRPKLGDALGVAMYVYRR